MFKSHYDTLSETTTIETENDHLWLPELQTPNMEYSGVEKSYSKQHHHKHGKNQGKTETVLYRAPIIRQAYIAFHRQEKGFQG